MILVPENEFSHLKGVSKQPYLDIRTVPNISLCNRFSEVLWCNRSARMHSWFLVSPTFCFWLWTTMFVFEPFVMVWKNKGPNVSSNNSGEQEPLLTFDRNIFIFLSFTLLFILRDVFYIHPIGHFQAFCLCVKTSLNAKPFVWFPLTDSFHNNQSQFRTNTRFETEA